MNVKKTVGTALALAAAGMFAAAPVAASSGEDAQVHCFGVNACKGHNDCKTANNACKGMASCQGTGFVAMSKHACEAIGGSIKDE